MGDRRESRSARTGWIVPLAAGAVGLLLVLGALGLRDLRAGDRFDLVRWEVETFPNRWVAVVGEAVYGARDDDEVVAAYFGHAVGAPERDDLRPDLQLIVEQRIDAVVRESGVDSRLPLPGSAFPPVNIQIASAPYVLVTSPRSAIERSDVELLRPDLPAERALEIEASSETEDVAAIVLPSGGVATYPAIVGETSSYRTLLRIAAHEWVHHYVAFYPLGFSYFETADLRTMNETIADIVGDEIAELVLDRWGDPTRTATPAPAPTPDVDVSSVLRDLRIEVDELLAAGRIDEAELRMDEVRDDLEGSGVFIRRINQAYFAWFGTYAARPDAVDPLGEYLREIRTRSGSLAEFMALVRDLDSRAGVEEVLVRLGGALRDAE